MKPIFLCSECENELGWGDQFCGNCGKPVEWPTESAGRRVPAESKKRKGDRRERKEAPAVSWKMMVGFAVFIAAGVVILELLTGGANVPTAPVGAVQPGMSANMEAMNRLNELEQLANANPGDLNARLTVANFAHDNRFYDKAITAYKQYLEKKPNDPDALVDLGICYNDLDNFNEARRYMGLALKISPKHLHGHFNLGIVNLRAGNTAEAIDWFRKTVALSPNSEVGRRAKDLLDQHLNVDGSSQGANSQNP